MSATNRCLTLSGPGSVITAAGRYESVGNINFRIQRTFRDLQSSLAGKVGKVLQKTVVEVKFQPISLPSYAPLLISLQPTNIGESIFGCTDAYLDIHGRDGTKLRFKAAAVSDPPEVFMDGRRELYGDVTFRCVVADETTLETLESLKAISTASFSEPSAASNAAAWVERGATVAWGDTSPFDALTVDQGPSFKVSYELEDKEDVLQGYYDSKLAGVNIAVKFRPTNIDLDEFFEMVPVDGSDALAGTNLADLARELIVMHSPADGGLKLTLPAAAVGEDGGGGNWDRTENRIGEVTLVGVGSVTDNVPNALFSIIVVAAPVNTVAPAIDDTTPTVGQTLTRTTGTWTDNPDSTFATEWQRSDNGSTGWAAISGATAATYVVQAGDATKYLRAKVTATNDGGSTIAYSAATSAVAGA